MHIKSIFAFVLFASFLESVLTQTKPNISEKYYQLIEAPSNPEKWNAWRLELRAWKDSTLKFLNYKGENYQKSNYKWASKAYATFFLMANDRNRTDGYNNFIILRGGSWYANHASEWYADGGAQKTNFGAKYLLTWTGLDRCATVGFRCVVDIQ